MTKNRWTMFFISLLIVFGLLLALPNCSLAYQNQKPAPRYAGTLPLTRGAQINPNAAAPGTHKNEIYDVVSEGEDIKAIRHADLNTERKTLEDGYKEEMKKYQAAKKDKNNHDASTLKMPSKKDYTLKILKSSFKTQEEAQKYVEELLDKKKGGGKKTIANNKNNNW